MIKEQATTQEKPIFGVDFKQRKKRVQNVEKPVAPPVSKPKKLCAFQVLKELRSQGPFVYIMGSFQCEEEALENGWCEKHQHAQIGMDEGKRLGYRSIEIADTYTIIGQGEMNWEAYFERATGSGLAIVMDYLRKQ